mmetsp:Transcript_75403/g.133079  ORF Transcript_75403/g.133079 Transcript_75403/m.133079 type:complete len:107 (+) Transcript_75403:63-383(+)|eukprot:CAMPEP_0197643972 /NCGR_PEP_ID=MMETSP1338-20131121/17107_1 /TAXON_ID=43686 ORGANISM="Pelagodinium beii, Strain RCC1491" /NCGR_SAMPLE_ID=MMETSP1338 /ASSEMBLY_ACC=CAM_ASM_000754 /LENGTH=106 /DNA_ID=CAMNT_0043217287 /DNA_START=83 /DNA_END=403 /DNA_ORIENTATION=+
MARSSSVLTFAVLAVATYLLAPSSFVSPPQTGVDARVFAATAAGLTPLAVMQPAHAVYDSVVAMLQSWLFGGTVMIVIYGLALLAAIANPLTIRRKEVEAQVKGQQ